MAGWFYIKPASVRGVKYVFYLTVPNHERRESEIEWSDSVVN